MAIIHNNKSHSQYSNSNAGAGYVVAVGAIALAAWGLWVFVTRLLGPALALAGALAAKLEWLNLGVDILWGAAAGFFVGWLRWRRSRNSKAVESLVEAVANPDTVSAASLGWRYVLIHVGAGLLAGLIVGLLGLAFPSHVFATAPPVGVALILGGGGEGGEGGGGLLILALLFLLLIALPLLGGLAAGAMAFGVKGAASGAAGAAGKLAGLALFVVLTRIPLGLPRRPEPEPRPQQPDPPPDPGPFDLDQIVADFLAEGPLARRFVIERYKAWLQDRGIAFDARGIGENAPVFKEAVVYDFARCVNYEVARRTPGRKDLRLRVWEDRVEAWEERVKKERAAYEKRLSEELFGPGWLKRAFVQGLGVGAFTGAVTALLVTTALALFH